MASKRSGARLSPHLRASDLRGAAQLATQGVLGVARVAEGVHQSVLGTLGLPGGQQQGQTAGLTGLIYRSVRGVTGVVGRSLDAALAALLPAQACASPDVASTRQREAVLAALNGVVGDRMAAGSNPLATPMTLRLPGAAPVAPAELRRRLPPGGKLLLFVHGLCMNDLQWQLQQTPAVPAAPPGVDLGALLSEHLGYTPVYLRYNTGLHISQNGRSLAAQLAQLLGDRPHPVTELAVVAHSMGGLVMRSAIHCAQQEGAGWLKGLKHLVFLGTPHHGAPLERTGHWVELLLGKTPYSAPFAKLVQLRSAGITDLRYGFVADADWLGKDRFRRAPDTRQHVPLPEGVACHAFAATLAGQRSAVADRLVGDGLVPLPSALGQHDDPARSLVFDRSSQRIAYRTHHNALLTSPEVGQQLLEWLGPRAVAQQ